MILHYQVADVRPFINWIYFYFAWGVSDKPQEAKKELREDAERVLDSWQGRFETHAIFRLLEANSEGDDLIVDGIRIPLLRQQHPTTKGGPNLCLADFVRPISHGIKDEVGAFVTTVDAAMQHDGPDDPYAQMLAQTLSDRLAEATTERMHLDVRKKYWGYAPNEELSLNELFQERYQGIRPAVGYPSLPDASVNFLLDQLLDMRQIGVHLTENAMMVPHSSVSGFMFSHPKSRYFDLGAVGEDQLQDYAQRRGLPVESIRKFLTTHLMRK